jgi:hypothetical protein
MNDRPALGLSSRALGPSVRLARRGPGAGNAGAFWAPCARSENPQRRGLSRSRRHLRPYACRMPSASAAGGRALPWRLSRSVIDSVCPAIAESAPADSARPIVVAFPSMSARRSSVYVCQMIAYCCGDFLPLAEDPSALSSAGACLDLALCGPGRRRVLEARRARSGARRAGRGESTVPNTAFGPGGEGSVALTVSPRRVWCGVRVRLSCAVRRLRPAVTLPGWGGLRSPWRVACTASRPR